MLAAFQQAALLAKGDGDRQAARTAYQDLQRSATDPIYRDLAVLLGSHGRTGAGRPAD